MVVFWWQAALELQHKNLKGNLMFFVKNMNAVMSFIFAAFHIEKSQTSLQLK